MMVVSIKADNRLQCQKCEGLIFYVDVTGSLEEGATLTTVECFHCRTAYLLKVSGTTKPDENTGVSGTTCGHTYQHHLPTGGVAWVRCLRAIGHAGCHGEAV